MSRTAARLLPLVVSLLVLVVHGPAQEELDWGVGEANLVAGKYREAESEYRAELTRNPGSAADRYGLALTLFETGRYDEARSLLEGLVRDRPKIVAYRLKRAELDFVRGNHAAAEAVWREVLEGQPEHFEANARLGRLEAWRGRPDRAEKFFRVPERAASRRVVNDPEELLYLGWCYWGLGRLVDASQVFREALQDEEHGDIELYPAYESLISLYLENHYIFRDRPPYQPVRDEAFRNNPHHPGIHLVMADVYIQRMETPLARAQLDKALAANPNLVHGLCLKAYFAIDRMDFEGARKVLEQARKINPVDKETAAYFASLHYIVGDNDSAEKEWKRVLSVDPSYGTAFYILAELLGDLRRYEEAYRFARRAVKTDPKLWKAWDSLGRFALHTSREKEAIEALEHARDGDPFGDKHPYRHNLLELYSHMDEFLVHEWGPFRLRIHSEDNPVMKGYLKRALDEAYRELSRKYGFTPKGPIRVEVFSKPKDFSVRTVAVPGIRGLLGACFGQVITLNSPSALPAGSYVWMATLWHEFAHVVTLQMSEYRVSRWLTEGLSVYEEKCRNPAWEDVQDEELYNALVNGTVAPVRELDGLFRSRRIGFAYLQSLHLVEFIIARYGGFDRLPAMLRSYAKGKGTEAVLRDVLGLDAKQFDRAFLAYLKERFAERRIQREYTREAYQDARATLELDPNDLNALRAVAWFHFQQGPAKTVDCEAALGRLLARAPNDPSGLALRGALALRKHRLAKARIYLEKARQEGWDEFYLRLHLARLSAADGKTEDTISHLQAAKRLFPRFVGPGNPYLELARIYRKKGEPEKARREIEAFVGLDAKAVDHRVSLAEYYLEHGNGARAVDYLREATQVSPFSIRIHHLLARSLASERQFQAALEEVDLAIILAEDRDPAKRPKNSGLPELKLERARILRKMGRLAKARAEAEAALRDHPDHAGLKAFLIELKETDAKGK